MSRPVGRRSGKSDTLIRKMERKIENVRNIFQYKVTFCILYSSIDTLTKKYNKKKLKNETKKKKSRHATKKKKNCNEILHLNSI